MAQKRKSGYVYALSDGVAVRYVGQTLSLTKRYGQHCSLAQNMGKLPRNTWIKSLLTADINPTMTSLEQTDDMDTAEIKWIKFYREQGVDLLNVADGGQTMGHLHRAKKLYPWGKTHSPTQRILMMLKSDIRTMERFGKQKEADHIREKYSQCVEDIDRVGRDVMNYLLWEKEQEKKNVTR